VENITFVTENELAKSAGKKPATSKSVIMGVTEVALTTESWLSSSSFQHTTRVLVSGAVRGATDPLRGLKENIIVGNLIPAGTGKSDDFIVEASAE
jgi:DNA-directed RNA polymerase subunit beta'